MKKFLLRPLAALSLMLAASASSFACVCLLPAEKLTPEQARAALAKDFGEAFAVFSGEVVALDTFKVTFKVEKIWKGGFGDEIVMRTGAVDGGDGTYSVSSCDYGFRLGEKYLVYAYGDSASEMKARACARTRELKFAAPESKDLDELSPHEKRNERPAAGRPSKANREG